MSNLQIPKKYLSCTTEIQHCRVMSDSQIPKNICHEHIRVMSDSQIPKNVCRDHICAMSDSQIPQNVCHDHIRVMSDSQIPKTFVMTIDVSCQTHKLLK